MTPRAAHKLFQVPRFHLSSSWFPKPNHARLEKKPKRREGNKTPRYPEYLDRTPFRLESSLMIFNLSDTIFCLVKIKALTDEIDLSQDESNMLLPKSFSTEAKSSANHHTKG